MPAALGVSVPQPQYSGVWVKDDTGGYREIIGAESIVFALPSEDGGGLVECNPWEHDAKSLQVQTPDGVMYVRLAGGPQLMGLHNVAGVLIEPGKTDLTEVVEQ